MEGQIYNYLIMGSIVSIGLLFTGFIALYSGIQKYKTGTASKKWPSTYGTIIKNHLRSAPHIPIYWTEYAYHLYTPKYVYQYKVENETYQNNRLTFGKATFYRTWEKAIEKYQQFPEGSQVQVFYEPDNPENSVLIPGTKGTIGGIFFGIVLILIAILGIWLSFHNPTTLS